MIDETKILNLIYSICKLNNLGEIKYCQRMNLGFNRIVYDINGMFVIKICTNPSKENGVKEEIRFLNSDNNCFHPKLLTYDISKDIIPYIYTIEEKFDGPSLFDVWADLSIDERKMCLFQLIQILKQINVLSNDKEKGIAFIRDKYNLFLSKIDSSNIVQSDKMHYLLLLRDCILSYFEDAKYGYIHGDIHFNNIIYSPKGIKLIDFECYGIRPLDMEFDPLNRMIRNPNSLIKSGIQKAVNPLDYVGIMDFFKENYSEVCMQSQFDERLLIYDCLNSLKWMNVYPEHQLYHEVLFEKSKRLIK